MDLDNTPQPPREVLDFYARGQEDERLDCDEGKLERCRTEELLLRHLPVPPAVVLDVGGGTGQYATWLAARGYTVHLVDPVPLHLEQARARSAAQPHAPLASVSGGDARRLDWADGQVDAVLLLGPLYHLTERSERLCALNEAWRVLHPNGVVLVAAISRFASALDGLDNVTGLHMSELYQTPSRVCEVRRSFFGIAGRYARVERPGFFCRLWLDHAQLTSSGWALRSRMPLKPRVLRITSVQYGHRLPNGRSSIPAAACPVKVRLAPEDGADEPWLSRHTHAARECRRS